MHNKQYSLPYGVIGNIPDSDSGDEKYILVRIQVGQRIITMVKHFKHHKCLKLKNFLKEKSLRKVAEQRYCLKVVPLFKESAPSVGQRTVRHESGSKQDAFEQRSLEAVELDTLPLTSGYKSLRNANMAQLVAHHLAKVEVAGSNPAIRSEPDSILPDTKRNIQAHVNVVSEQSQESQFEIGS